MKDKESFKIPPVLYPLIAFGLATGCKTPEEPPSHDDNPNPDFIEDHRVLPLQGLNFLNNGEHTWDNSQAGILSSIDVAGLQIIPCPEGAETTSDEFAVAVTTGVIVTRGDEENLEDPNHSIVGIKEDETGIIFEEMHIAEIPDTITIGTRVKAGDVIGRPSCEIPPGGATNGVHLHLQVRDSDGNFIPIRGTRIGNYIVEDDTMLRSDGVIKTESASRCYTDDMCGGIRNDLTPIELNTPEPAGESTYTPPIPGIVPTPERFTPVPQPTNVSTPEPTAQPTPEATPFDPGWTKLNPDHNAYEITYPSNIFNPPEYNGYPIDEGFDLYTGRENISDQMSLKITGVFFYAGNTPDFDAYVDASKNIWDWEISQAGAGDAQVKTHKDISGYPAKIIEGNISGVNGNFKFREYVFISDLPNAAAFSITFMAPPAEFSEFQDEVDETMDNFLFWTPSY